MSDTSLLFVARARTALKLAFSQIGFAAGDKILVPGFVCEALVHPIVQTGLVPVSYPVAESLEPEWEELEALARHVKCRAIIMVHYFGQPQDIDKFRAFSERYRLVLIEDNAHGHGGMVSGRLLGSFGDVGISSPRKFLGVPSGGCLFGAASRSFELAEQLPVFPAYGAKSLARSLAYSMQPVWRFVKGVVDGRRSWGDPLLFREPVQSDFAIDRYSRWRIQNTDWPKIASVRRKNWRAWASFAKSNGLKLVFADVHWGSCPLALPAYAENIEKRNRWLEWGAKHRVPLFPWPSLSEAVIRENGEALSRWKRLVCFPLESSPHFLDNRKLS